MLSTVRTLRVNIQKHSKSSNAVEGSGKQKDVVRITRHYGQGWTMKRDALVLQELTTQAWQSQVPNSGIREELESENYPFQISHNREITPSWR